MRYIIPGILALFALATAANATEADKNAEPTTQAAATQGEVARANFTSAVENREPTDQISSLENKQEKIYYFTEIRDMAGKKLTHRWEHNGKVMAEIPFQIGGDRWRVYSSKQLDPNWTGEWKASVVDEQGNALAVNTFNYSQSETSNAITEDKPAAN